VSVSWQKTLAAGLNSVDELLDFLRLPNQLGSTAADRSFKTRLPLHFARQMEPGNPQDPLLLQVLASQQELTSPPSFSVDPLQEANTNPLPGLIHKYPGRVLIMPTSACAIHCRYCFRRHFPYADNQPNPQQWQAIFQYLSDRPSIHEVIFSGGDPLLASDLRWQNILAELSKIPHVHTLRIHTRVPVVLPERITAAWLALFSAERFKLVMVLHCNHPKELTEETAQACRSLRDTGFHLFNQSVLLKGVNNHVDTLTQLSQRLFQFDILPYYLHLLDSVVGSAHFEVTAEAAATIYQQLQTQLPGYLLPKLVREEAGKLHKTLV
jgi:EF-P beta-lysylation protein EpmB